MSERERPKEACCIVCGEKQALFVTEQGAFLCWGHLEEPPQEGELGRLREEVARLEAALKQYPLIPDDVWIGRNGPADKVTWLIRRLEGAERTLRKRT